MVCAWLWAAAKSSADAIAAPPEAFQSDRLHARSSQVPASRAAGEARLGQRDEAGGAAPDVTEGAFTIDFKPESGSLTGLWLRLRAGVAEFDDGTDVSNVRFIVNYALPIL